MYTRLGLDINCKKTWMASINELETSTLRTDLTYTELLMDFYSIKGIDSTDKFNKRNNNRPTSIHNTSKDN